MNEDFTEKWSRKPRSHRSQKITITAEIRMQPAALNPRIMQYYKASKQPSSGGAWTERPAVPTSAEVLDEDEDGEDRCKTSAGVALPPKKPQSPSKKHPGSEDSSQTSSVVVLPSNKPKGPWQSKGNLAEYLKAHYELLREDAVKPLRDAVSNLKVVPEATEESFNGAYAIYEKVHICGITCSTRGVAVRVTFSTRRAGKKILWAQSKRLVSGSLVALSPSKDKFEKKVIVATVAARPKSLLFQNPPEIDLFIARAEEFEIDPEEDYVMVQDRSGYFEGQKHTLMALQMMNKERQVVSPFRRKASGLMQCDRQLHYNVSRRTLADTVNRFPLVEHLVDVNSEVSAPKYLQDQPIRDLTKVFVNNEHEAYQNVDLLKSWPTQPHGNMDASQTAALKRILTKRLAVVQGPPGTGKTYVSVEALKILVSNLDDSDPPIIIACQTNHALDQLLHHVATFVEDWARVGGQSKDVDIKKRTVYELHLENKAKEKSPGGAQFRGANESMGRLEKEIVDLISPLAVSSNPLDHVRLQQYGLITADQMDSLVHGASRWVQSQLSNPNEARSPFLVWLGKSLVHVPFKAPEEDYGFDFEEAELEVEQLRESEAENPAGDDDDIETLKGTHYAIADNFTSHNVPGVTEKEVISILAKAKDLWKIPEAARAPVYRYLQRCFKQFIRDHLRPKIKAYNQHAELRQIGKWETQHEPVLKKQKVIGMTTTGFSKYRALVSALQPQIVLIEEAAETLEAPIIAACVPSLQHLILVGDHQQLRPHCQVKTLEGDPFFLNVSLFERMISNHVEYDTLRKQRRMIPEIRRLLYPIYKDLIEDHQCVTMASHRPDVPGMGGVNSFFFTHHWPEERDENMSAVNTGEADMIIGFVRHLMFNAMTQEQITILTFYNGQRKHLAKTLRRDDELHKYKFKVVTVDSYQGEENDVVILSLTRSNDRGSIGFLDVDNRVCVALSRAKRGFYLFGNGQMLHQRSKTWKRVLEIMAGQRKRKEIPTAEPQVRLGEEFPVRCSKHNTRVDITAGEDWQTINGGCTLNCNEILECGHVCPLKCHPFPKDWVSCQQRCERTMSCGHKCTASCGDDCVCGTCTSKENVRSGSVSNIRRSSFDGRESVSQHSSNSASWRSFAQDEAERYAVAASQPPSYRTSPVRSVPPSSQSSPVKESLAGSVGRMNLGLDGHMSPRGSRPGSRSDSDRALRRTGNAALPSNGIGHTPGGLGGTAVPNRPEGGAGTAMAEEEDLIQF